MGALQTEQVTAVHHWNESLFSFRTTRDRSFRFRNGHFTMLGLPGEQRPLMRAYSIASANHEDGLEFFSIKVPDGPLTSRLQQLQVGDEVLIGSKATGSLITENLRPGKRLHLIGTGTGLAPFLSIIKDPGIYEQFEQVVLAHGVRQVSELAYAEYLQNELPNDEYLGDMISAQLKYYPTVTREPFRNKGRLTELLNSCRLFEDLGLPQPDTENDRFMLCGSPAMLKEFSALLEQQGFTESRNGHSGEYVIERAFVES